MCGARGRDREGVRRDLGLDFRRLAIWLDRFGQYLTKPSWFGIQHAAPPAVGRRIASRIPPGHIDWSRIHGCKFQFQSPKPKRRCIQKRKGRVVANPCPTFSNLAKILPQTSPNPSQTFPKPSQNRIQTLPNQRKLKVQPRKQEKLQKNRLPPMIGKLLGHILEAQSLPREAQGAPKTSKMEPKTWKNRS